MKPSKDPTVLILADGARINRPQLQSLLQKLFVAQDEVVAAAADKRSALKAINDAGYDKKVAQRVLARRNRNQLELSAFDEKVEAYEVALGTRDMDFNLEVETAAVATIDPMEASIQALREEEEKAVEVGAVAPQKAVDIVNQEKPAEDGKVVPMKADDYQEQFLANG